MITFQQEEPAQISHPYQMLLQPPSHDSSDMHAFWHNFILASGA